ncbi:MAG TPA: hypothetical protein VI636_21070 [Candidatus Angelobacter sp.]
MRGRFSLSSIAWLVLLAITTAVPVAPAQGGPDVFVTPIPNAPFSGVIQVERSFVQRDGSVVNRKTIRDIGRDGQGRIFNQYRMLLPDSSSETPQVLSILVYDPQTRASTTLFPQQRTFRTGTANRPPETMPPNFLDASSTGSGRPQNQFTKQEDLGIHEIAGLPAHGLRETQTIPAESNNTGRDIVVTDECWYSEDLRINLVVKHSDPRKGAVTMTVNQVTRTEPDPALFRIPDGYTPAGAAQETKQ